MSSKNKVDITWRPWIEQSAIAISGSSQQSAAFGAQTYAVRIALSMTATAGYGCHFSITGPNPTATANSAYLPAGGVEYIAVAPGDKIAVIRDGASSTGNFTITELTH